MVSPGFLKIPKISRSITSFWPYLIALYGPGWDKTWSSIITISAETAVRLYFIPFVSHRPFKCLRTAKIKVTVAGHPDPFKLKVGIGVRRLKCLSGQLQKKENTLHALLYQPHRENGSIHLLWEHAYWPGNEKKALLRAYSYKMVKHSPSRFTRGQKCRGQQTCEKKAKEKVIGALNDYLCHESYSSSLIPIWSTNVHWLSQRCWFNGCKARKDNGNDESIVPSKLLETTVLNRIERMRKNTPVTLKVMLNDSKPSKIFISHKLGQSLKSFCNCHQVCCHSSSQQSRLLTPN